MRNEPDRVKIYLIQNDPEKNSSKVTAITDSNLSLFTDFFSATRTELADLHELTGF